MNTKHSFTRYFLDLSLLFSFFLIIPLFSCKEKEKGINPELLEKPGAFQFDSTVHHFGEIIQGQKVKHTFKFKNTGVGDLIISDVQTSCGCTVPDYPKDPIPPGESGEIVVEFNSENKQGEISKTISIFANTIPNETELRIKAFIKIIETTQN